MFDQEEAIDTIDRLKVMLHQEEHLYSCPDYFDPDSRKNGLIETPPPPTPLHVIEECAKLVTDLAFADSSVRSNQVIVSPHDVRKTNAYLTSSSSEPLAVPTELEEIQLIPSWRSQMCDWAYTVVDTFGFSRALVAVGFDFLDRFLAKECLQRHYHQGQILSAMSSSRLQLSVRTISREEFQLWSMTCLYIAIKLHESEEKLSIPTMVDMSRCFYTLEDFEDAESVILQTLEWRLSPPTANSFLVEFFKLYPSDMTIEFISMCYELLEVSVADAFMVPRKDSQLAFAAMLVAGEKFNIPQDELDVFVHFVRPFVDVKNADFVDVFNRLKSVTL